MLYDTKSNELKQYNEYLSMARDSGDKGIQVDADVFYQKALSVKPSLELYVEIGEFYKNMKQTKKAINWGNTILNVYPKMASGYEFLMNIYIDRKDYVACFDLVETMEKRKISSALVDEKKKTIEYEFFFNGEYIDAGIYSGEMCPVKIADKWGYVNLTGDKVIASKFSKNGPFSGELAPVIDSDGNAFFIDPKGNKKHVVQGVENIKELGLIENDLFSLNNGESWGFYNKNNMFVFGEYEEVSSIGNGVAAVKSNGKWSLVDRNGKDTAGKTFENVAMDEKLVVYRNERLFVYYDSNYHMIDLSGKEIGSDKYESVRIFNDSSYAAVKINGKWGFVDKDGNFKIDPTYEDARSFSNGLAAVKVSGKWGFINENNEIVIQPQFDDSKDFNSNGCVFVLQKKDWKLLRLYKNNH
ncbi:MAG: WG repeat-containing protein [Oscillospiraceae bacterium]